MSGCPVCIVKLLLLIWCFADKLNDVDDDVRCNVINTVTGTGTTAALSWLRTSTTNSSAIWPTTRQCTAAWFPRRRRRLVTVAMMRCP